MSSKQIHPCSKTQRSAYLTWGYLVLLILFAWLLSSFVAQTGRASKPILLENIYFSIQQTKSQFRITVSEAYGRKIDVYHGSPSPSATCEAKTFALYLPYHHKVFDDKIVIPDNKGGQYYCLALVANQKILKTFSLRINYPLQHSVQRGRLIDDDIFTNHSSMSSTEIQDFLTNTTAGGRFGSHFCDRYGEISNKRQSAPTYTCLFEYRYNPWTKEDNYGQFDDQGNPKTVQGGLSAGQIIYRAAQDYKINPQVLIALLQREQTLITDPAPTKQQYDYAAGFACPDTTGCQKHAASFYRQVRGAAWSLRKYTYHIQNNLHLYGKYGKTSLKTGTHPDCPSMIVDTQNSSTASLYIYTPYVHITKNLAQKIAPLECHGSGNFNFWHFFNTSFGSSLSNQPQNLYEPKSDLRITPLVRRSDQPYLQLSAPGHTNTKFIYVKRDINCSPQVFTSLRWSRVIARIPVRQYTEIDVSEQDNQSHFCFGLAKNNQIIATRLLKIDYELLSRYPLRMYHTFFYPPKPKS